MSQKELLYIEDIFNHELLTINILNEYKDLLLDDDAVKLLTEQSNRHQDIIAGILNLVEEN